MIPKVQKDSKKIGPNSKSVPGWTERAAKMGRAATQYTKDYQ